MVADKKTLGGFEGLSGLFRFSGDFPFCKGKIPEGFISIFPD
jgi:hypothetical protein